MSCKGPFRDLPNLATPYPTKQSRLIALLCNVWFDDEQSEKNAFTFSTGVSLDSVVLLLVRMQSCVTFS